jgi:hypothetical protein
MLVLTTPRILAPDDYGISRRLAEKLLAVTHPLTGTSCLAEYPELVRDRVRVEPYLGSVHDRCRHSLVV